MKSEEIWGPSGVVWLEEHLAGRWDDHLEASLLGMWDNQEKWLLECHPWNAFLLVLREYLLHPPLLGENRLRRLIPILAQSGNSVQTMAALALLGILIVEARGQDPESEAICRQLEREQIGDTGLDYVLSMFLFAQEALVKGNVGKTSAIYQELLEKRTGFETPARWVLGRVYEKMGIFLSRGEKHPLEMQWQFACDYWCGSFGESVIANRLRSFSNHPVQLWKIPTHRTNTVFVESIHYEDLETQIIREIVVATHTGAKEIWEKARFLAQTYGDPFWLANSVPGTSGPTGKVYVNERVREPEYRFTFFESFQGYDNQGKPLFPQKYGRKKVKHLLAILLLQPHYRMVKEILLEQLFASEESFQKENYLYVLVHRLREVFARESGLSKEWITIQGGLVSLREDWISGVDVEEYRKLASVGHQLWPDDEAAACVLYEQAVRIYNPVLAPEFEYEEWGLRLREQLMAHQERMLKRLWECARKLGQTEKGLHYGESLLELNQWDLSVVHQLIHEWEKVGEIGRIGELCERYVGMLEREGEEIPAWLLSRMKKGKKR